VVTGVPEVLSRAFVLPTPCGYRLLRAVQFLYRGGIRADATLTATNPATRATTTTKLFTVDLKVFHRSKQGNDSGPRRDAVREKEAPWSE
jgi:hypothetical protein